MIAHNPTSQEGPPAKLDEPIHNGQAGVLAFVTRPSLAFLPNAPLVEITNLLELAQNGDEAAREELLSVLYNELHGIARRHMRGQPLDHTLQATALVNEAWMRMSPRKEKPGSNPEAAQVRWSDRQHFLALASRAMRCVLVDHARRRDALKRKKPGERLALDRVLVIYENRALDLEGLDAALTELEEFDPTMAKVVELRFFGGLDMQTVAELMEMPKRSLERRWLATRSWLKARIQ
jgi:RNA polymerase sigma factor (TIGR02999 family)